jgi:hypothetical protein
MEAGNAATRRRIETRLLTRQDGQWQGYTYLWNEEQSDAVLVEAAGTDRVYEIKDVQAPGGSRKQSWRYPSRVECMVCHSRAANWVLGLTTLQMNKDHDYGKVVDNQLRTLEHIGLFKAALPQRARESRGLVNPYDPSAELDARARSYLHANCAQCHVEAGGGNAAMELEFTTARNRMRVFDVPPLHHTYDIPDARLIAPGHPERSTLYVRVARRGAGQMPPLATSEVDQQAVQLLHDWIKQMPPDATPPGRRR